MKLRRSKAIENRKIKAKSESKFKRILNLPRSMFSSINNAPDLNNIAVKDSNKRKLTKNKHSKSGMIGERPANRKNRGLLRIKRSANNTLFEENLIMNEISFSNAKYNAFPYSQHQSLHYLTKSSKRDVDPALFDKLYTEKLGKISDKVKEESISHILNEERELTFKPKIKNPFKKKRRSVEEFLEDMVN